MVFNCKRAWFETEDAIVMIDGDTAKFATVYRGSGTATNVSTHNTSRRDVLVLCVERQFLVERVYPPLINKITAKASSVQIAGTVDEAVSKLNQSPPPLSSSMSMGPSRARESSSNVSSTSCTAEPRWC